MKKENKDLNIFEKIQYYILGIFYGQNSKLISILILVILGFGLWFKVNGSGFAQSDYLYGYINKNGETTIKPQFDKAGDFHEGLAYACKYGHCGYINQTGTFIIKPEFAATGDFNDGLAAVKKGNSCGYIDKTGKFVIKPKFIWAGDFHEGLAQITFWDGPQRKNNYTNGIKDSYDSGKNPVKTLENLVNIKDGYIDKTGKIVMIFPPCSITSSNFYNGLAVIQIDDRYGFIDRNGNMVISPKFDDTYDVREIPIAVKQGELWGYINKSGDFVVEPKYNEALKYSDGIAAVKEGNSWGYINKIGKFVINPQFNGAGLFNEDIGFIILNNKLGFIDKSGKIIVVPQFEKNRYPNDCVFHEGMASVNLNNKIGFINKNGNIIVNPIYDDASKFNEGLVKVGIKK